MTKFLAKPAVKIIVSDAGLGGLSVCAELAQLLERRGDFEVADIVYFNACPDLHLGYDILPNMAERTRVFNCALEGMQRLNPDAILIACNTLSVMYENTPFSRKVAIPVVDIVGFGVDLIQNYLQTTPAGQAIIFGTPTTIEANTHLRQLIARGVDSQRIVCQPCPQLPDKIENGPERPPATDMIENYVRKAVARLPDRRQPLAAALCCTHFGYSRKPFVQSLARHIHSPITILNPNSAMSACLTGPGNGKAPIKPCINVSMLSKYNFPEEKILPISQILAPISQATADALKHYRYDPALFEFKTTVSCGK